MMSVLNKEQIVELLQIKTPDEIREDEHLDAEGEQFLRKREAEPGVEDFLRESGRYTRDLLDRVPEVAIPNTQPSLWSRLWSTVQVPKPLAAIATACMLLVAVSLVPVSEETFVERMRGLAHIKRLIQDPESQAVNEALFQALKDRGLLLYHRAEANDNLAMYEEALSDLRQARQLKNDPEVVQYMMLAQQKVAELDSPE